MKQKIITILFLFYFFPMFSACSSSNTILLTNETEAAKEDLHLFAGEQEIWSGVLKPGEQKKISFSTKESGTFSVLEGLEDGSMFHVKELGYFSPKDGAIHQLIMKRQNRIFYQLGK